MNTRKNIDATATTQNKDISSARDEILKRVEKDYEEFKETHIQVSNLALWTSKRQAHYG